MSSLASHWALLAKISKDRTLISNFVRREIAGRQQRRMQLRRSEGRTIVEAISYSDIRYLDRKTDVILLKVSQHRITGSGIALLNAQDSSQVLERAS